MKQTRPFVIALAALGLLAAEPALARVAPPEPAIQQIASGAVQLSAPDGRRIDAVVWQAPEERAVVIFSHGFGGVPAAYADVVAAWAAGGFTVIAPLHVDSQFHPERQRFDGGQAFVARIEDLAAVRDLVRASHPGKPMIAAGHSFGSLMSLIAGGAVTAVGPQGDPDVRAVVAFSSPGDVPGLVTPDTWAGVSVPLLMITGDQDLVPGFVTDWRAHRGPFDRGPAGGKLLLTFEGGGHNLVRDAEAADAAFIRATTLDFLRAHALGDAAALARLESATAPTGATIERR